MCVVLLPELEQISVQRLLPLNPTQLPCVRCNCDLLGAEEGLRVCEASAVLSRGVQSTKNSNNFGPRLKRSVLVSCTSICEGGITNMFPFAKRFVMT